MSTENDKDRERMRLYVPERHGWIDRLIEETEDRITNTKAFLDRIQAGEERTQQYIKEHLAKLEGDLRRLERQRREPDNDETD